MTILEQYNRVVFAPARYVTPSSGNKWLHTETLWSDEDIDFVKNRVNDLKQNTELDDWFVVKITKTETVERL